MNVDDFLPDSSGLSDHHRVLGRILDFFRGAEGTLGAVLSGSTASGGMDRWSDLDVGVVFATEGHRERAWADRWSWDIAPWFHRFDADHIKPYFVIYFYEPEVKADIALYTREDMPAPAGRPYRVAWDRTGDVAAWARGVEALPGDDVDWSNVVHEDERFWAWMFYTYQHIARGEHYHVASEIATLRDVVEQWAARFWGWPRFEHRRLEKRVDVEESLLSLRSCFPSPDRAELREACLSMIHLQNELRTRVDSERRPTWKTLEATRRAITECIRGL